MALWLLLSAPEVAVKVAVLWPDATVTLAGTVSNAVVARERNGCCIVAAGFNVIVQVLDALLPSVEGAQVTDVNAGGTEAAAAVSVKLCEIPLSGSQQGALIGRHCGDGCVEGCAAESGADYDARREQ